MDKRKITGFIFGGLSILTVLLSYIFFEITRGPNADTELAINTLGILSILGILLSVLAWFLSKRLILPVIGFLGSGAVFVFAFLLLFSEMGGP